MADTFNLSYQLSQSAGPSGLAQSTCSRLPNQGFDQDQGDSDSPYFDDSDRKSKRSRDWHPSGGTKMKTDPSTRGNDRHFNKDLFNPEDIRHTRSSEWEPSEKVAFYLKQHLRQPLDREVRNKLRAECPRPSNEGKVAAIPEMDTTRVTCMGRLVKYPKRGIDRSWRSCQDKLLDNTGPLMKIMEMAEDVKKTGAAIDPEILSGWTQSAICLLGTTNCVISEEARHSLLLSLDPKLGEFASAEAGPDAMKLGGRMAECLNKWKLI
ncbi:hypothetical protein NDU88_003173 [Pleurodeles waltl]|uniref:Uncharacterized protein n=1 Tax=Pleurodeles waltl TaxID=8319 RepID=A0AAV7PAH6_PLEWA|nr:hypothetical protein NDU88_003173 [Pleurodeles waltl]